MSGLDIGGAINASADWMCSAPIIRNIVGNPVFTSLLITALTAIVAMALYNYPIKQAGGKRAVRALLYVFLLVTAVIFVHHYAVTHLAQETVQQKGVRDIFSSIKQSQEIGGAVPVYPMGVPTSSFDPRAESNPNADGPRAESNPNADGPRAGSGVTGGSNASWRPDNIAPDALQIRDVVVAARTFPGADY